MGEKTGGHLRGEADEGTGSPEPQSCGVRVQRGGRWRAGGGGQRGQAGAAVWRGDDGQVVAMAGGLR